MEEKDQKKNSKKKILWITPDHFLDVDIYIIPILAEDFEIDWIIINAIGKKGKSDGLIPNSLKPKIIDLKHRQRNPLVIFQYLKLIRYIRSTQNDLIYISFRGIPYFLPLFFLFVNLEKVIYGAHDVRNPNGIPDQRLMELYHNYIYKRLKKFHVFSKHQLKLTKELLPDKTYYYAPLTLKDFGPSTLVPSDKIIRFLFFGYIKEYKRLDLLIKSFQHLYQSGNQNIELYIAGNCHNWDRYKHMINPDHPIKTRIGMIPNSDIPDLLSSCHYLVLPYQDLTQSGVLALAYNYNKPVIASDIEPFKEFIVEGETGFLFANTSQESLTSVMQNVISKHKSIYPTFKKSIETYVKEELSVERVANSYKDFLNECINENNK